MKRNYTLDEINSVATDFINKFKDHRHFAFYAEMGTGKTTLINTICQELGSQDANSSPTFSIVNEYESPNGILYHMDFYRLESLQEAVDIGIDYYFDSDDYCFMEWPSKIEELLPKGVVKVFIKLEEDQSRSIHTEI